MAKGEGAEQRCGRGGGAGVERTQRRAAPARCQLLPQRRWHGARVAGQARCQDACYFPSRPQSGALEEAALPGECDATLHSTRGSDDAGWEERRKALGVFQAWAFSRVLSPASREKGMRKGVRCRAARAPLQESLAWGASASTACIFQMDRLQPRRRWLVVCKLNCIERSTQERCRHISLSLQAVPLPRSSAPCNSTTIE